MVYPQYPENQPEVVPWPTGYDDQERERRSPVLAASIAGIVAVLVLAVGVLLGVQLSRPDSVSPLSPSPTAAASAAASVTPTTASEPATREAERTRARDAERLDRSTYSPMTARDFALMAKNPDSWT